MKDDYSSLIIQIDSREKDQSRIKAIQEFFESHNAIVEMTTLKSCDYAITGLFHDVNLNIGIEHKVLTGDFFPSLNDMPTKFFEAYKIYNDVCLFIEEGAYNIKITDDGMDAWIQNHAMQAVTGVEGIGTLSMYNNFLGSMSEAGIHVRPFRSVAHFPIVVSGLIKHLTKPIHRGIALGSPINTYQIMMNQLVWIPGIGAKSAEKMLQYIPNFERFITMSLEDFQNILGAVKGKQCYQFLKEESRKEECAKNWDLLYEKLSKKQKPSNKKINQEKASKIEQDNIEKENKEDSERILNELKKTHPDANLTHLNQFEQIVSPTTIKETELLPRVTDVLEYIRQKPRTSDEIRQYFGLSHDYTFTKLMEYKNNKKIWFENSTKKWNFGLDNNPMPVKADTKMDLGV